LRNKDLKPFQALAVALRCSIQAFLAMAEVVHDAQQDFWRPPTISEHTLEATTPAAVPTMAELCVHCGSEFMIGARFCHTCGTRRPVLNEASSDASVVARIWVQKVAWLRSTFGGLSWKNVHLPDWLHYLHFHEIKRWVGLPTASLIAFFVGLGCVLGLIGVSVFYRASNLAEFQAIQMWRIEWLLGATASFVAGILLKKPSSDDKN
jgi:hypothetical protein